MKILQPFFWLILIASFCATPVFAQDDTPEPLIVLLDVPDGGTAGLEKELVAIGGVAVKNQKWFLGELSSRGISPKRILRRPKDLKWVFKGANITYIVYLARNESEEGLYDASFVDSTGESTVKFTVERTADGLDGAGAKRVALEMKKILKKSDTAIALVDEAPEEKPKVVDDGGLAEERELAAKNEAKAQEQLSAKWLEGIIAARIFSREMMVTSANGTQLSYASAPYPGFELKVVAFPGVTSGSEFENIGVVGRLAMGIGSVDSIRTDSMLHLEGELGAIFRLIAPVAQEAGDSVSAQAKFSLRYTSFMVDSAALPETSMIAPTVGASIAMPVIPKLAINGYFDVVPLGIWGGSLEGFGESAYTFSFSGGLGFSYAINEMLGIVGGIDMRLERTIFQGRGDLGFEDARAIEFLQSAHVGAVITL